MEKIKIKYWTGITTIQKNGKLIPKRVEMVTIPDVDGEYELSMLLSEFVKRGKKLTSTKKKTKPKKRIVR